MAPVNADIVTSAQIKGGRLFIRNRRAFDQQISQFKDGWEVEVAVTRRRATRSVAQNAYYWGVVVQLLSGHTGYTPDEVHDILKMMFLPKHLSFTDGNGEVQGEYVIGGSTRKLNVLEFGEYMESVKQWAAESLDVVIPDPSEAF